MKTQNPGETIKTHHPRGIIKSRIVLGITASVAAYKGADLANTLKKAGHDVHVIMTKSATKFITPLTLQSLTKNKVYVDMFEEIVYEDIRHISLAQRADIFVIAPATANIIGKIANGIADDMLSTVVMATDAPVLICPAMNTNMYENPIVQYNMDKLESFGYYFVEPKESILACGDLGRGALADIDDIIKAINTLLDDEFEDVYSPPPPEKDQSQSKSKSQSQAQPKSKGKSQAQSQAKSQDSYKDSDQDEKSQESMLAFIDDFPPYSIEDIKRHLKDPEVGRLFYAAETIFASPLSDKERHLYLAFYEDLGLPVDVICVLFEYCVDNNKKGSAYMRTVARDWANKGIKTADEAEGFISLFNNEYREVLRALGISGRDPIDKEMEYINNWLKDGWSMEFIKLACEKCIMTKGRGHFGYVEGVLNNWNKDGIKTLEEIEVLEQSYYNKIKPTRKNAKDKDKGGRAKFQNYQGRNWDHEKLELMEREYLDKE